MTLTADRKVQRFQDDYVSTTDFTKRKLEGNVFENLFLGDKNHSKQFVAIKLLKD